MGEKGQKLASAHTISRRGEGPNPIDIYVGRRLRHCRTLMGLSQERLGDAVGITFQQLQKYERGFNRISASRLFNLAQVLKVPVTFFFENMPAKEDGLPQTEGEADADAIDENDPIARRETLELVRAYYRIDEDEVRRRTFELIKALGGNEAAFCTA